MPFAQADTAVASDTISVVLVVAGVLLIAVLMMVSIRGKIASRQADRPDSRETISQIRAFTQQSDDSHQANAAFYETAQRLMAQLDNKAERLEQLIADADQRLERLAASGEPRESTEHHNVIEPKHAPQSTTGDRRKPRDHAAADPLARSVYHLADTGRNPVEIAQELDEQIGKVELILALRTSR